MFLRHRTLGIIIKKENRGEADQLFTVYTNDFGKLEILGKSIRKISSKLRSGAEIFYLSEIEFIQGKAYKTLTGAVLIEKFKNLREDLNRLKIAYQISEILDILVRGQERDKDVWEILVETFEKLDNLRFPDRNLQLVYYYFLFNFFSVLGYRMGIYNCSVCGKKIMPGRIYFSSGQGGVICQSCSKKVRNAKEIGVETVKILRVILRKNWKIISRIKIEKGHLKILEAVSAGYISYVLGIAR